VRRAQFVIRIAFAPVEEMSMSTTRSAGVSLFFTALATAPLLMPGARRRYGTFAVMIGVFGLAHELWNWMEVRRADREFIAVVDHPDVVTSPHLRAGLE
jgi:hypothetical protein